MTQNMRPGYYIYVLIVNFVATASLKRILNPFLGRIANFSFNNVIFSHLLLLYDNVSETIFRFKLQLALYLTTAPNKAYLVSHISGGGACDGAVGSRKVAGSIPDGVIGIFHSHNPSGRAMALGSTQSRTAMSTRNIFWGVF
jgi:hypothetical protein